MVDGNSTGLYAIASVQVSLIGQTDRIESIKVDSVKVTTISADVELTPCRLTLANATGGLSIASFQLQGGITTSQCNCTCKIKGLPTTQWISLAALFANQKCPPPPDDRTAVFFIPFELRSTILRNDFPIVIPVNATKLAMGDGAGGKGFPERYLELAYKGDPNLEERLNFFKNTCGPGGYKCSYIYGIMAWVKDPKSDTKVLTDWSFTPTIATLDEVEYGSTEYYRSRWYWSIYSHIKSLTFSSPYLGNEVILKDEDGNLVPEVYVESNGTQLKVFNAPYYLSDHWGFFSPSVKFQSNYTLYTVNGIPIEPSTPSQVPAGDVQSSDELTIQPEEVIEFAGKGLFGDVIEKKGADKLILYDDNVVTGKTAYGVINIPFTAMINGTVFLEVTSYDVGYKVFLDGQPVFSSWIERTERTITEKVWKIELTNMLSRELRDVEIPIKLPSELIGKPITVTDENGNPIPFCYEEGIVQGQLSSYGPCTTEPSPRDVRIWLRVSLPPGPSALRLNVIVGTNGATDPKNVFHYYDNFDVDMGWKSIGDGRVVVPNDEVAPLYSRGAAKKDGACDPQGGYLEIPDLRAIPDSLKITIRNPTGNALNNVQVRIETPFKGTSVSVKTDAGDLPFCYETSTGECTTDHTKSNGALWILISSLAPNASINVTVTRGEEGLVTDPRNIFLLYDDFNGNSLDPNWISVNNPSGQFSIENGLLIMWGDWNGWWVRSEGRGMALVWSSPIIVNNNEKIIVEGRARGQGNSGDRDLGVMLVRDPNHPYDRFIGVAATTTYSRVWVVRNPNWVYGGSNNLDANSWRFFKVIYGNSRADIYRSTSYEGILSNSGDYDPITNAPNWQTIYVALHGDSDRNRNQGNSQLDWIRVRKEANVEIRYLNWAPSRGVTVDENHGYVLEFFNYRLREHMNCPITRVGLEDDSFNGFTTYVDFNGQSIGIDERTNGNAYAHSSGGIDLVRGAWYFTQLAILPHEVKLFLDGPTTGTYTLKDTELRRLPSTQRTYTRIVVRGGWPYWIDELRIREYVDETKVYGRFVEEVVTRNETMPYEMTQTIALPVKPGAHVVTIHFYDALDTGYLKFAITDKKAGIFYKPLLSDYGYGNAAGWVTVRIPFTVYPGETVRGGVCVYVKYWPLEIWYQLGGPYMGTNFLPPINVKPSSTYIPPPQGNYGVFYAPLERGCYDNIHQSKTDCPSPYLVNEHGSQPSLLVNIPFKEDFNRISSNELDIGKANAEVMKEAGKWNLQGDVYVGDFDTYLKSLGYPIENDNGDMEVLLQNGFIRLSDFVMDNIREDLLKPWVACFNALIATRNSYSGITNVGGPEGGFTFSFYKQFDYIVPSNAPDLLGFYGTGDSSGFGVEFDPRYTTMAQFDGTNSYWIDNEPLAPHYALIYRDMFTNWLPGEVLARFTTTFEDFLNAWKRICVIVKPEDVVSRGNAYFQRMSVVAYEMDGNGNVNKVLLDAQDVTKATYGSGSAIGHDVFVYDENGNAVKWYVALFTCSGTTCATQEPNNYNEVPSNANPVNLDGSYVVANANPYELTDSFPIPLTKTPGTSLVFVAKPDQGVTVFDGPSEGYVYEFDYIAENIVWTKRSGGSSSSRAVIVAEFQASSNGIVVLEAYGSDYIKVWHEYQVLREDGSTETRIEPVVSGWFVMAGNPKILWTIYARPGLNRIIVQWGNSWWDEPITLKLYNGVGKLAWKVRLFYDDNFDDCPGRNPRVPPDPSKYIVPNVNVNDEIRELLKPPTSSIPNFFDNGNAWDPGNVYEVASNDEDSIWFQRIDHITVDGEEYRYPIGVIQPLGTSWFLGSNEVVTYDGRLRQISGCYGIVPTDAATYVVYQRPPELDEAAFVSAYSIVQITKPTTLQFQIAADDAQAVAVAKVKYDEEQGKWIIISKPRIVESNWAYTPGRVRTFSLNFPEPGYYIVVIYFADSCCGGGLYVKVNEVVSEPSSGFYIPPAWSIGFTSSGNIGDLSTVTLIDDFRLCQPGTVENLTEVAKLCAADDYYVHAQSGEIKVLVDDDFNYMANWTVIKRYEAPPGSNSQPKLGLKALNQGGNGLIELVSGQPNQASVILVDPKIMENIRWLLQGRPWLLNLKFKVEGDPEGFAVAFYKKYYPLESKDFTSVWQVRPWGGSALGLIAGPNSGYSPGYAVEVDFHRSQAPPVEAHRVKSLGLFMENNILVDAHVALVKDSPYALIGYHAISPSSIIDGNWHELTIYVDPQWSGNCYFDVSQSIGEFSYMTYCLKPNVGFSSFEACSQIATCGGKVMVWIDNELVLNTSVGLEGFSIPEEWFLGFTASNSEEHYGTVSIDDVIVVAPKSPEVNDPKKLLELARNPWVQANSFYVVYLTKKGYYIEEPWSRRGALERNNQIWGLTGSNTQPLVKWHVEVYKAFPMDADCQWGHQCTFSTHYQPHWEPDSPGDRPWLDPQWQCSESCSLVAKVDATVPTKPVSGSPTTSDWDYSVAVYSNETLPNGGPCCAANWCTNPESYWLIGNPLVKIPYRGPRCLLDGKHWAYYGVMNTTMYFTPGTKIYIRHDDGIKVWIDNNTALDLWDPTAPRQDYYVIEVPEGYHTVTIQWYDMCNGGVLQVLVATEESYYRYPSDVTPIGCWHAPLTLDDDWVWFKATPSSREDIPSFDLSQFPFYGVNWLNWIAIMVNGDMYFKDDCTQQDWFLRDYTPNWNEFLGHTGIYPFFSDLIAWTNSFLYAGWHGAHIEKWTQYGYSHGQRWASIWWDESFYPYWENDPWLRARFGATLYESGDVVFHYDRADLVLGENWTWPYIALNWFFSGITSGNNAGWSALVSTVKSFDSNATPENTGQQVGIFADVWSGLDLFDRPKKAERPDMLLKTVNDTSLGEVSLSECRAYAEQDNQVNCNANYESYAFTSSKDVLFQYQGSLFTVVGGAECLNCKTPAIQPPPSPQPAKVAEEPPDCYCVCGMQSQPTKLSGNVTSTQVGLIAVTCNMTIPIK